jgi:hypothetical protein
MPRQGGDLQMQRRLWARGGGRRHAAAARRRLDLPFSSQEGAVAGVIVFGVGAAVALALLVLWANKRIADNKARRGRRW